MRTCGSGMPHEPALRTPRAGVKVPTGEVSVMPQPSLRWQPVSSKKRCSTSTGSGAPPDPQNLSERRSISFALGCDRMAVYIVGTPGNTLILLAASSFITASTSKRVCSTSAAPRRTPSSIAALSAKMWKSGSTTRKRSLPSSRIGGSPRVDS